MSDGMLFAKTLKIEEGFLIEELEDYNNITFRKNEINVTRVDPPNTSKEDI